MTTLYRPVLIESAEQAEALPIGTVAMQAASAMFPALACIRVEWGWKCSGTAGNIGHDLMVGDTALVPIEAEEETRDHPTIMLPTYPPKHPQQTRYVTPWEEA